MIHLFFLKSRQGVLVPNPVHRKSCDRGKLPEILHICVILSDFANTNNDYM